jgi:putative ABC transport system substrate-binding protein
MRRRDFIAAGIGAAVCPLALRAQQPVKVHKIAFVHPSLPMEKLTERGPFFAELRRLGYIEGSNLVIAGYTAAGIAERSHQAEVARDAVRGSPDLILAIANAMARAATSSFT